VPTSNGFTKRYELHYQLKKVENDEGVMFQQFGCLNFHARRYSSYQEQVDLQVNEGMILL
jgi:hypothetical protein